MPPLPDDPFDLFLAWYEAWATTEAGEPAAMVLATASPSGRPRARNVLLRGVDRDGFVWFTDYDSRKGEELARNPQACLVFTWLGVDSRRQVLVTGTVARLAADESDAYWATRPRGSQLSASASPQSRPIPDRAWLEDRVAELAERFPDVVPRPEHWGGYRLTADEIEFWQGQPDRLHDRFLYTRTGEAWRMERLAP